MFRRMDDDGSKNLGYDEFRKGIDETGLELSEEGYKETFAKLDKTGDGVVTIDDLRGVYDVKNHPKYLNGEATEEELYRKFLGNFETNGLTGKKEATIDDGKVTAAEFMDYYSGISASIDQDSYFDLMVRTAWK